jgi:hypothetical protein
VEESELSERQRKWLETSRKIGRSAMTKTEKQTLERLYAELLPAEQQELANFIQEKFGKKDADAPEPGQTEAAQDPGFDFSANLQTGDDDPTAEMEQKSWKEPSKALLKAFSKPQKPGK